MSVPPAAAPDLAQEVPAQRGSAFRSVATWTLGIWGALCALAAFTKVAALALAALALTGALPFILAVLWLGLSTTGVKLRQWFDAWDRRVFAATLLFFYGAYAHKWAGDVLNEIFHLDGRFFGITSTVLAVFFTPFGLFYRPDVIGSASTAFVAATLIVAPVLVILLFSARTLNIGIKRALILVAVTFAGSFFFTLTSMMASRFNDGVKAFALWADFNDHHLCTNAWPLQPKSVVFLDNGEVLGYFPGNKEYRFKVIPCNNEKTF